VRVILWSILLKTNLPKSYIYIIIKYYDESYAIIECNGKYSDLFRTLFGVKQGSIISPRLFALYVWALIKEADDSGFGAKINELVLNILLYADDIILVSFSRFCLQALLNITGAFGIKREIKFNPDKSVIMIFENDKKKPIKNEAIVNPFTLNGQNIPVVNSMRYLGIFINDDGNNKTHIEAKISYAKRKLSELSRIGIYSYEMNPLLKAQVYQTMIRPILIYGSEVSNYNIGEQRMIRTADGNMIKEIIGINKRCHHSKLTRALNLKDIGDLLNYNKCSFFLRMIKHKYTIELMKNVIVSLPPPKGRFQLTTSFFEEIFKLIKIDYVLNKGYVWEWQNVIERTKKKIAEYDSCHLKMKDDEEVVEIRKILELPYITMVSTLNDLLLAIEDNRMSESEDSVTDQSYD